MNKLKPLCVVVNIILLLVVGVSSVDASTNGKVLFVRPTATSTRSCSSWQDACDLQTALKTAKRGSEIWVQAGLYTPALSSKDWSSAFQLKSGVALYGGFAGTEISRDQRDWVKNITVLSGDIGRDDKTDEHGVVTDTANIVGKNTSSVVTGRGVDATALIDGFTITAGSAVFYGGGMSNYAPSGSPTLNNMIFSGNRAASVGGGMFNYMGSNPHLSNVLFIANASGNGGAMVNHASSPTLDHVTFSKNSAANGAAMVNYMGANPSLTDVTFSDNKASNKAGGVENDLSSNPTFTRVEFLNNSARYGSGMYNYQSSPTLIDVTFTGNMAGHVGGAMENEENSNPTLTFVTFARNKANHEGGAMFNTRSSPVLTNVTFADNSITVDGGGGGMMNYFGSNPILTNVTFSGNTSVYGGGGMSNWASAPTLTNVTFSANRSQYGAGMFNGECPSFSLTNVTFTNNVATDKGGAIANYQSSPNLTNAVVWGNSPLANQVQRENSSPNITYSDIQGGYPGAGNLDLNPRFEILADNGSYTQTHALQVGSPAIDAGNPAVCSPIDQRGVLRPVDGNGDGKASCDMGTYEYLTSPDYFSEKLVHAAAVNAQAYEWNLSIVDLLKSLGLDSSYVSRKELATTFGCPVEILNDRTQMNAWLLKEVLKRIILNSS